MPQKSARFFDRGDAVEFRGRAAAERGQLRKDEPHPVAPLLAGAKFSEGNLDYALLGVDEALTIEGLESAHQAIMALAEAVGKSGWRLSRRRQQPGQNVEYHRQWASQQSRRNEP